jgi:hypothetical protein
VLDIGAIGWREFGDDRSLQGVLQCFDQIACVHMSGLFVRSQMNAGQDGFRDKEFQTERRPHGGPLEKNAEFLSSWID